MGLKILHSADWHLDSPFSSFPEEQRAFLRREQARIPGVAAEICLRENCDLVLLAGDIFDGIPGKDAVEKLKEALTACAVPVFIAPGNHDCLGAGSPWLEESWPENVYIFSEPGAVLLPNLDCRVYGAGYESMDCPALLEDFRAEGEERYHLMVLHGDPVATNSPYCPITAAQVKQSGLDYLALGHIHRAGSIQAGDTLCAWPGCPMGRGWDETGEKGMYVVTLEETAEIRKIDLDFPRFYRKELDIGTDAAEALDAWLPAGGNDHFYQIDLTGSASVDLQELKSRFARFPHLQLRDATEPPVELWAEAGEDTLRGVYFRLLHQRAESDDTAELAAKIAQKLLSGKEVRLP